MDTHRPADGSRSQEVPGPQVAAIDRVVCDLLQHRPVHVLQARDTDVGTSRLGFAPRLSYPAPPGPLQQGHTVLLHSCTGTFSALPPPHLPRAADHTAQTLSAQPLLAQHSALQIPLVLITAEAPHMEDLTLPPQALEP